MLHNTISGVRKLLLFAVIVFPVYKAQASVDECINALVPAREHLEHIELDLQFIVTKSQYQQSVKQRYDIVEALLNISIDCAKNKNLDHSLVKEWESMNTILTALQANARTCLFAKFENWIVAKETDLNIFRQQSADKAKLKKNNS